MFAFVRMYMCRGNSANDCVVLYRPTGRKPKDDGIQEKYVLLVPLGRGWQVGGGEGEGSRINYSIPSD